MKKNYIYLAFIFLFVFYDASSQEINFKDYYYQLEKFSEPLVYQYENPTDPKGIQYWEFISDSVKNHLITKTYNYKSEQIEYFEEKYTNDGSKVISYIPIVNGKNLRSIVKEKDVYKWNSVSPYRYSVIYEDPQNGKTLFEKKREFISSESIEVMGAKYEALKFKGVYKFTMLKSSEVFEYYQYSYYVKDWGFVKYIRHFPNGEKTQLILTRIFKKRG